MPPARLLMTAVRTACARSFSPNAENSYRAVDGMEEGPLNQIHGHSITYRIAVGPQQGRKVFTLQTLPACDPDEQFTNSIGKVAGFSLHAGVELEPPTGKAGAAVPNHLKTRHIRETAVTDRAGQGAVSAENTL